MKKIWIIAGESSGDLYGARLAEALRREAALAGEEVRISGMGGVAMRAAGVNLHVDSTELGVMGFIEVFKLIGTFIRVFFKMVRLAEAERPDTVVLIDYPGFNLRFARELYKRNIKVVWYISPQVWVWGKHRIKKLAKYCSKMLIIFPFEVEVFAPTALEAEFVGHPLVDLVQERRDPRIERDPGTMLLLPGSRSMEISRLWKPMLLTVRELARRHPELKFVCSAPREKIARECRTIYDKLRKSHSDLPEIAIEVGTTGYWQQRAGFGLAASGTVTVESAIAGLPLTVVYKMNLVTILMAALLVRLYRGHFTMVNIIADKTVYEEFLQYQVTPKLLVPAVERIMPGGSRHEEIVAGMAEMTHLLKDCEEDAATRAARAVWSAIA